MTPHEAGITAGPAGGGAGGDEELLGVSVSEWWKREIKALAKGLDHG